MRMIFQYLKPFVPRMSLGLTIKFIGSVMDLLLPWILSYMIDEVAPTRDMGRIVLWGGAMVCAALMAWGTNILANRMAAWVAQHTTQAIRHDLFEKISHLSCGQVDGYSIPSLEARLTTDTYNVHQMLGMMQRIGIRAPILLVGGILITLTLDPVLTLVLVCTLPLIGVLVYSVSRKGVPMYAQLQRSVDTMVRTVRETISGIRVIKALSKVDYEKERFAGVNAQVVENETRAGMPMAITNPFMNLFLNLGLTAVIIVGAYRVNAGLTQPGKIIAFLSYFTIILNAMMAMTRIFVSFSRSSASGERIAQVLSTPEDLAVQPSGQGEEPDGRSYRPLEYYHRPAVEKLVDFLVSPELLAIGDPASLSALWKDMKNKDWFMALLDVEDYIAAKDRCLRDYGDRRAWAKKMLVNIAKSGYFSSDRTIAQYNEDIWKLK